MSTPTRTPLSEAEIRTELSTLPGWELQGDRIAKKFQFKTFRDALAFIVRLGFEAEALDHHPDIANTYNRVTLALNTHDAGGKVTAMDTELARRIEKARAAMAP